MDRNAEDGKDGYERIPEADRLWTRMLALIGASYTVDTVVLVLFALARALPLDVALGYGVVGILTCLIFYLLISRGLSAALRDPNLTMAQLGVAVTIQLVFMALAPHVALYFISVLFVIFGFASLRLRPREGLLAVGVVALPIALVLAHSPEALDLPRHTPLARALVGISILLALGRATMLGLYSTRLRVLLGRRLDRTRDSLRSIESRRGVLAATLHEGLGQELAGVALMLTALAAKLRREGHPGAEEIGAANEYLAAAIGRTRLLADSVRSESGTPPGANP
ncbi:MAG: histidine kinase dimerization/phosphoacceptor domain-containing protein [Gammaproteobacteria bacterium]|nr:histidine kinase dimerization/phosphoacceptor domain-containing protein [Gammaproteobacteria bacterium]